MEWNSFTEEGLDLVISGHLVGWYQSSAISWREHSIFDSLRSALAVRPYFLSYYVVESHRILLCILLHVTPYRGHHQGCVTFSGGLFTIKASLVETENSLVDTLTWFYLYTLTVLLTLFLQKWLCVPVYARLPLGSYGCVQELEQTWLSPRSRAWNSDCSSNAN